MKKWVCRFVGRKIGAIGDSCVNTEKVEAATPEEARSALYQTYEHIHSLWVREVGPDGECVGPSFKP